MTNSARAKARGSARDIVVGHNSLLLCGCTATAASGLHYGRPEWVVSTSAGRSVDPVASAPCGGRRVAGVGFLVCTAAFKQGPSATFRGRSAQELWQAFSSVGLEHFPFSYAGSSALRGTSDGEKPRGLEPAARNTETGNALIRVDNCSAICRLGYVVSLYWRCRIYWT